MELDLSKPLEEWTTEELQALIEHKQREEKAQQIEETKAHIEQVQESLDLLEEKRQLQRAELRRLQYELARLEGRSTLSEKRRGTRVARPSLEELANGGQLSLPLPLRLRHKDQIHEAVLTEACSIRIGEKEFSTPSGAAKAIIGKSVNGWRAWEYRDKEGRWYQLNRLRDIQ
jgi:hypothetical protein